MRRSYHDVLIIPQCKNMSWGTTDSEIERICMCTETAICLPFSMGALKSHLEVGFLGVLPIPFICVHLANYL